MGQFPKNAIRMFPADNMNAGVSLAELHSDWTTKMKSELARAIKERDDAKSANRFLRSQVEGLSSLADRYTEYAVIVSPELLQLHKHRSENLERIGQLEQQLRLTAWAVDKVQAQRDANLNALKAVVSGLDAYGRSVVTDYFESEEFGDALIQADEIIGGADYATDLQHRLATAEKAAEELAETRKALADLIDAIGDDGNETLPEALDVARGIVGRIG